MTRIAPYVIAALALGLSACTNPYDPVQRGLGGGILGAASGAAIGAAAGGGPGAALGAAIGGATVIVGGIATAPPPPPGTIRFVHPESAEGKEISNVLVKYKAADELYPYKPMAVVNMVSKLSGRRFTNHNHTQSWKFYSARPRWRTKRPEDTNKDYCIYHAAHGDYTYSQRWVDHLVSELEDDQKWAAITQCKI